MAKSPAVSFESILDTPANEVERPKPIPVGTYTGLIKGLYEEGTSSKKGTPFVQFNIAITSAGEDVDADDLEEVGGIADKFLKNNSTTFYLTADSLWRLTEFLEGPCKIDMEGKTIRQALADTPNTELRMVIIHEPNQAGDAMFASIKKFLPID